MPASSGGGANNNDDFLLEVEINAATGGVPRLSSAAVVKRNEQLKRWSASDTNKEPASRKRRKTRVNFQDNCVFLAACQAGDIDEVDAMLKNGADINTTNVDGLTALHQVRRKNICGRLRNDFCENWFDACFFFFFTGLH